MPDDAPDRLVWLNGRRLEPGAAAIDVFDRGFALGDGLFETLRLTEGRIRHRDRHLARLAAGAAILGFAPPLPPDGLALLLDTLARDWGRAEGVVRMTLSRGVAPRGLLPPAHPTPTLAVTLTPPPPPAGPARLVTATVTRRNEMSPLARVKSLNSLDGILARAEAADRDADDAVLLNTHGLVAETTIATLVLALEDTLVTPRIGDGALPGIGRGILVERGAVAERAIAPADLTRASAVVLVNSLGVRPVASLDGRGLDMTAAGVLAERLSGMVEEEA